MKSIVEMDGEHYRLMPRMPLMPSVDLLLYGILEFDGLDIQASYLIPMGVVHHFFYRAFLRLYSVEKVLHKVIPFQ